jgi:hypothetical protein
VELYDPIFVFRLQKKEVWSAFQGERWLRKASQFPFLMATMDGSREEILFVCKIPKAPCRAETPSNHTTEAQL